MLLFFNFSRLCSFQRIAGNSARCGEAINSHFGSQPVTLRRSKLFPDSGHQQPSPAPAGGVASPSLSRLPFRDRLGCGVSARRIEKLIYARKADDESAAASHCRLVTWQISITVSAL